VIKISLTCGGRKSGASLFQSDRHMVTPPAGQGTGDRGSSGSEVWLEKQRIK